MLYSLKKNCYLTSIPHTREYQFWKSRLTQDELNCIQTRLNSMIDSNEIHTSSWMPGKDWTGTEFEAIYKACDCHVESAAMFFGIILYVTVVERLDVWSLGKYELKGVPIKGMTYFKLNHPPIPSEDALSIAIEAYAKQKYMSTESNGKSA
jgi:hypothetical protein